MSKNSKYTQLMKDLTEAVHAAIEAVQKNPNDGGTCNFDCMEIYFGKGWQEASILEAAKLAGTRAYKTHQWGSVVYHFGNPIGAMGDLNTLQAEAMQKIMKSKGYNAGVFYMMD